MTSPRQDDAPPTFGVADPTRDIRLPSLTDRPPSVLPREWSGQRPPAPTGPEAPTGTPGPAAVPRRTSPADLRTDELQPPPRRSRERTLSFVSPEMVHGRPLPTVARTPRRPRRWPWIVLALLPVVLIVVSGLWWVLLLRAA